MRCTITYFKELHSDINDDYATYRKEPNLKSGREKRVEKRAKIRKMKSNER